MSGCGLCVCVFTYSLNKYQEAVGDTAHVTCDQIWKPCLEAGAGGAGQRGGRCGDPEVAV